ncbi:MAG: lysylphosphatidylglycerol synthase transmembrane domain-containing protein [Thermoguttaceae bacterium]
MNLQSSFSKKWLIVAIKLLIIALVAWFVRDTLVKAWRQIGEQTWHWRPFWLISAGAIYLVGLLPAAAYWHYLLKVLGQDVRWANTLRAYYIGHLGKYVPGKAMVVILRAGLVRGRRVDTAVAAASVFFETLTMMAVGAFMAAGILAVRLRGEHLLFWGSIGLMIISGLPILPPVFRRLARLAGIGKSDPAAAAALSRLGWSTLLAGWMCMILVWALMAASLWAAFRAMGVTDIGLIEYGPEYIAAVSLSMVAGFLSFIPAGLGVRDLVLVALLVKLFAPGGINDALAAVAGGLLRLIWLVSELIISGILYLWRVNG